jgi:hypothetical protein
MMIDARAQDAQVTLTYSEVGEPQNPNLKTESAELILRPLPPLASTLLFRHPGVVTVWKLKRKQTTSDQTRIKTLEDRLDEAVAESRRMRRELETLQQRDYPAQPAKPRRRSPTTEMDVYDANDTVN